MLKNSKKGENETVETRVGRSKKDDPSKTKNCPGKSSSFVLARLSSPSKDQSEIERWTREKEEAVSILKRWKTEETQTGWPIGMLSGISLWLRTNCSMVLRAEKNRLFMHNTDKIWKLLKARAIASPNNVVSPAAKYRGAFKPTSQLFDDPTISKETETQRMLIHAKICQIRTTVRTFYKYTLRNLSSLVIDSNHICHTKHFEILLPLLRDPIIMIILEKFKINPKICMEITRYRFSTSMHIRVLRNRNHGGNHKSIQSIIHYINKSQFSVDYIQYLSCA